MSCYIQFMDVRGGSWSNFEANKAHRGWVKKGENGWLEPAKLRVVQSGVELLKARWRRSLKHWDSASRAVERALVAGVVLGKLEAEMQGDEFDESWE